LTVKHYFFLDGPHRARAAFRAMRVRSCWVNFSARAGPPFLPRFRMIRDSAGETALGFVAMKQKVPPRVGCVKMAGMDGLLFLGWLVVGLPLATWFHRREVRQERLRCARLARDRAAKSGSAALGMAIGYELAGRALNDDR